MNISTVNRNGKEIAIVKSEEIIIKDMQSVMDLIATIGYETGCDNIMINKSALTEDFFRLETKFAGEVLQKFVNYRIRLAIVGDFSGYTSKSLKDFIYESNKGSHIYFVETEEEALEKLAKI